MLVSVFSVLFRDDLELIPLLMECEKFDLVFVTERFKTALVEGGDDDDVLLDLYLEAFREILKFVFIVFVLE